MNHGLLQIPLACQPSPSVLSSILGCDFVLHLQGSIPRTGLVLPRLPLFPIFGAASAEHMDNHLDLKGLNPSIRGTASSCTGILCKLKRFEIWWFLTVSTKHEFENEFSGSSLHLCMPMAEIGIGLRCPKAADPSIYKRVQPGRAAFGAALLAKFEPDSG